MLTIDLHRRLEAPELMDSIDLDESELAPSLRFLGWAHRWLRGEAVLFGYLREWSRRWFKRPVSFLDVGTGGAEIPLSLARWGRKGLPVRITGLDSSPVIARIARERTKSHPEIRIVQDDFFSFARRGERFDYVVASLFLHHVSDDRLIEVLRLCDGMAERGVLISDLHRSPFAFWAVRLATAALADRVSRHDGPLSVRRAFTPPELEGLAARAGLPYLRVRTHCGFRVSLAGEKGG